MEGLLSGGLRRLVNFKKTILKAQDDLSSLPHTEPSFITSRDLVSHSFPLQSSFTIIISLQRPHSHGFLCM